MEQLIEQLIKLLIPVLLNFSKDPKTQALVNTPEFKALNEADLGKLAKDQGQVQAIAKAVQGVLQNSGNLSGIEGVLIKLLPAALTAVNPAFLVIELVFQAMLQSLLNNNKGDIGAAVQAWVIKNGDNPPVIDPHG
jgi:hypothetical protein